MEQQSTGHAQWAESRPFAASREVDQLAAALVAAQAEMPAIEADQTADVQTRTGGKYSYKYADLAAILKAVRPVLARHGLSVLQPGRVERPEKGAAGVVIQTILLHASGQWMASELWVPVADAGDPQKVGSGMTYGRRYGFCGMVGVAPEKEDDDAQAARQGSVGRRRQQAQAPEPSASDAEECITTANADGSAGGQKGRLLAILREHRIDTKEFGAHLKRVYGVSKWDEIRRGDYDAIVALAQAWPRPASDVSTEVR